VVGAREEREPADNAPVLLYPIDDADPFVFGDRYRRRWIVLGEVELDPLPVFELVECGEVVLESRIFGMVGRLDREFENVGIRFFERLPHFRIIRHALVAHELEKRVGRADAHAADIVGRVARMDAGGAVEGL